MSEFDSPEALRLSRTLRCTQFDRVPRPHVVQEAARDMAVEIGRGLPDHKPVKFRIIVEARVEE